MEATAQSGVDGGSECRPILCGMAGDIQRGHALAVSDLHARLVRCGLWVVHAEPEHVALGVVNDVNFRHYRFPP